MPTEHTHTIATSYMHPDGAIMVANGDNRYVRAESLAKNEKPDLQPSSPSSCDCPIHATRNNKPA